MRTQIKVLDEAVKRLPNSYKASPSQETKSPLTNCFIVGRQDGQSFFHFPDLTWVQRFWCNNAVCTKHVLRVAPGALEHIQYPTAVRVKGGALSHQQAQLFRRIDAGQTAENRITMNSSKRRGPGCRTNHSDGLKGLGATVLRMAVGIAAGEVSTAK
jgi:hypothetical protein